MHLSSIFACCILLMRKINSQNSHQSSSTDPSTRTDFSIDYPPKPEKPFHNHHLPRFRSFSFTEPFPSSGMIAEIDVKRRRRRGDIKNIRGFRISRPVVKRKEWLLRVCFWINWSSFWNQSTAICRKRRLKSITRLGWGLYTSLLALKNEFLAFISYRSNLTIQNVRKYPRSNPNISNENGTSQRV